jgi:hypothetical protein
MASGRLGLVQGLYPRVAKRRGQGRGEGQVAGATQEVIPIVLASKIGSPLVPALFSISSTMFTLPRALSYRVGPNILQQAPPNRALPTNQ